MNVCLVLVMPDDEFDSDLVGILRSFRHPEWREFHLNVFNALDRLDELLYLACPTSHELFGESLVVNIRTDLARSLGAYLVARISLAELGKGSRLVTAFVNLLVLFTSDLSLDRGVVDAS